MIIKELQSKKKIVEEGLNELNEIKNEFESLKKETQQNIKAIAGELAEVELLSQKIDEKLIEKKKIMQLTFNDLKHASESLIEIKNLVKQNVPIDEKKAQELDLKLRNLSEQIEKKVYTINSLFEKINLLVEEIKSHEANSKQAEEKINIFEKELNDLKYSKQEMLKVAKSILIEIKENEEKINQIDEQLQKLKTNIKDIDEQKIKQEIEKLYSQIVKESMELAGPLREEYNNIKNTLNQYSNFFYQYKSTIEKINNIEDRYHEQIADKERTIDEIDEVREKYKKEIEQTKDALGEKKVTYEKLLEKAKKIDNILENIRKVEKEGEQINKKITGLIMETGIAEMETKNNQKRLIGRDTEIKNEPELPENLIKKIKLTQEEEKEFERKRDELRFLIEKILKDEAESAS
jgi:chromosome segregation ATPase